MTPRKPRERETIEGESKRESKPTHKTTPKTTKRKTKTKPKRAEHNTIPPADIDPLLPLDDPKEEHFCNLIVQKYNQTSAYRIAINPKARKRTAAARASGLAQRPDVARRIVVLQAQNPAGISPDSPSVPKPKKPEKPEEALDEWQEGDTLLSLLELQRKVTQAVRQARTSTEKTQAVKAAQTLLNLADEADKIIDPLALIRYVATSAGRRPQDIAAQAGGLRHMLERVAVFSKAPRSVLIRVVGRWYREMMKATPEDTPGQATQPGKHLLPDGQSDNTDEPTTTTPAADQAEGGEGGTPTHPLCPIEGHP